MNRPPIAETFCDVALIVKFYCEGDVAKSFWNGPTKKLLLNSLFLLILRYLEKDEKDDHTNVKTVAKTLPEFDLISLANFCACPNW